MLCCNPLEITLDDMEILKLNFVQFTELVYKLMGLYCV